MHGLRFMVWGPIANWECWSTLIVQEGGKVAVKDFFQEASAFEVSLSTIPMGLRHQGGPIL